MLPWLCCVSSWKERQEHYSRKKVIAGLEVHFWTTEVENGRFDRLLFGFHPFQVKNITPHWLSLGSCGRVGYFHHQPWGASKGLLFLPLRCPQTRAPSQRRSGLIWSVHRSLAVAQIGWNIEKDEIQAETYRYLILSNFVVFGLFICSWFTWKRSRRDFFLDILWRIYNDLHIKMNGSLQWESSLPSNSKVAKDAFFFGGMVYPALFNPPFLVPKRLNQNPSTTVLKISYYSFH